MQKDYNPNIWFEKGNISIRSLSQQAVNMQVEPEWWKNPIAKDIYATLRSKENELPFFRKISPQLEKRRYLVDWLASVCDKKGFRVCPTAHHLAVYLMDFFMDRYEVDPEQLCLVALGCLLIAAKYEEKEVNIPRAQDFITHIIQQYSLKMYLEMELCLLHEGFNWNIGLPTPAHFIEYYMIQCISASDFHIGGPIGVHLTSARKYLHRYKRYFLEVSLQYVEFRSFLPSMIAASCICASRACLHISPLWPSNLKAITQYSWKDIEQCVRIMLNVHYQDDQASQQRNKQPMDEYAEEHSDPDDSGIGMDYCPGIPPVRHLERQASMSDSGIGLDYSPEDDIEPYIP